MADYDETRLDGEAIPTGASLAPGALGEGAFAIGTLQSVTPGNTTNTVAFSEVSGATTYNLYWGLATGITKLTGTKISDVTSPYVHLSLVNGIEIFYIYTASNGVEESNDSNELSGTPSLSPPITTKIFFGIR